jgi:5-methylcytosine-specific restriction endonuclease McrA
MGCRFSHGFPTGDPLKRPCLGCRALIQRGSYCRRCMRERRGTGGTQQAFRRRTLKITDGRCARCGVGVDVEAHHVIPIAEGGDKNGLGLPLCARCHRLAHRSS